MTETEHITPVEDAHSFVANISQASTHRGPFRGNGPFQVVEYERAAEPSRGTRYFARLSRRVTFSLGARAAFAVASSRSEEVFNPPDSYTLWRLPVEIEDQLEDAWAGWLESPR